jgi:hypothetical protein
MENGDTGKFSLLPLQRIELIYQMRYIISDIAPPLLSLGLLPEYLEK